ncbi:hypothetical protein F53441_4121 [Fusarium austroafricanum]|uniref:Heterokaryon incompatibility domain-containing protein n=1 Tax=Fusarium austroafricanum TaxID=2364996 RepID=A0A8H4KP15_9HYPO|nr:hypothetical protein F53441_4121 [Fusarium austroafricanum]
MSSNTRIEITETGAAPKPRYLVIHQVKCPGSTPAHSRHPAVSEYLDIPRLFVGDNKATPLRGRQPAQKALHEAKGDPSISFAIYRTYNCLEYHTSVSTALQEAPWDTSLVAKDANPAVVEREHMEILSPHLSQGIDTMKVMDAYEKAQDKDKGEALLVGWEREQSMMAPYLHFYHARDLLRANAPRLMENQPQHITLLLEYLDNEFGDEYLEADRLFNRGWVTKKHFHKLFGPNQVLATLKNPHPVAMISKYPPMPGSDPIRLECETWDFNGRHFAKLKTNVTIPWPKYALGDQKVPINSLAIFPLRFDARLEDRLRKRGEIYWQLRKRKYIEYIAPSELLEYRMENGRYMVDMETFRRTRGENILENLNMDHVEEYLSREHFESPLPPAGNFSLLMPPTTSGFGFHDKKWRELAVEYVRDIVWDEDILDRLVLPQEQKDILSALVVKKAVPHDVDIIAGEERGVKILLHGITGSGKTFTAKVIAEVAKRPLYELASSDIGTRLEDVENNVNEAFYLGRIWDAADNLDWAVLPLVQAVCWFKPEEQLKELWRNTIKSFQSRNARNGVINIVSDELLNFDAQNFTTFSGGDIWKVLELAEKLAAYENIILDVSHNDHFNPALLLHFRPPSVSILVRLTDTMRLINTHTLAFKELYRSNLPKYAILSHTWGPEEVTFQDWADRETLKEKAGFKKIVEMCEQAKSDGYLYAWVDTNCIDKSSSAELTEAINSMFTWYRQADICYAYLSDVPTFKPLSYAKEFRQSRWFKRGWTLQELLAPEQVIFYAADWSRIGTKATLVRDIAAASGISIKYLCPEKTTLAASQGDWAVGLGTLCHKASVAERMSWLSRRETTRLEDMAYCMLGIFGISMPLLYGEGPRAFLRLQEEILKSSDDHSLFCWSWTIGPIQSSLLSPRPHSFLEASQYQVYPNMRPSPYTMTNAGLSIRLPLIECWSSYIAILNVRVSDTDENVGVAISADDNRGLFTRGSYPDVPIPLYTGMDRDSLKFTDMFIPTRHAIPGWIEQSQLVANTNCKAGSLLSFGQRYEFRHIETFPPNRFREDNSTLVICPADDDAMHSDWIVQPDEGFIGATVVKFLMTKGDVELMLFTVKTTNNGSYLLPQWECCSLAEYIPEDDHYDPDMESLVSRNASTLERLVRDLEGFHYGIHMDHALPSLISADIATSGFTTTTAATLKHIHINFRGGK